MQAAFGPHKSTKLFKKLFSFDESLTTTNSISNRYFYPVCPRGLSIIPNPDYKIQVTPPRRAGLSPMKFEIGVKPELLTNAKVGNCHFLEYL